MTDKCAKNYERTNFSVLRATLDFRPQNVVKECIVSLRSYLQRERVILFSRSEMLQCPISVRHVIVSFEADLKQKVVFLINYDDRGVSRGELREHDDSDCNSF